MPPRRRALFITEPTHALDPDTDSTLLLMNEAVRRGWDVDHCPAGGLLAQGRYVQALASAWYGHTCSRRSPEVFPRPTELGQYALIWVRLPPPYGPDHQLCTQLLEHVPAETLVLNRPAGLRAASGRLLPLRWPELLPPTLVTRDPRVAMDWIRLTPGPVVLKPSRRPGGALVTSRRDENALALLELQSRGGQEHVIVQRFVERLCFGERRVLLWEGEPVAWYERAPRQGGRGQRALRSCGLTVRDRELCAALRPELLAQGLLFVGVDIIDGHLIEVDASCPSGIFDANALQGGRLEQRLLDRVEQRLILGTSSAPEVGLGARGLPCP